MAVTDATLIADAVSGVVFRRGRCHGARRGPLGELDSSTGRSRAVRTGSSSAEPLLLRALLQSGDESTTVRASAPAVRCRAAGWLPPAGDAGHLSPEAARARFRGPAHVAVWLGRGAGRSGRRAGQATAPVGPPPPALRVEFGDDAGHGFEQDARGQGPSPCWRGRRPFACAGCPARAPGVSARVTARAKRLSSMSMSASLRFAVTCSGTPPSA